MVAAFRIFADDSKYRTLIPTPESLAGEPLTLIDSKPAERAVDRWPANFQYSVHDPTKKAGHFLVTDTGNFACTSQVLEVVRPALERDCEFLPISVLNDAKEYRVVHVVNSLQAIPPPPSGKRTTKEIIEQGMRPPYQRTVFDRPMLFRDRLQITFSVCISGLEPATSDFFRLYTTHKFTGLLFRKVWEQA